MKRTWTPEQIELLIDKYPESTPAQLLSLFPDKTKAAIRTKATVLGLKKKNPKFRFTPEQLCELKRDFSTTLNKDLANRFGCSIHTIESIGFKHKLKKDAEFIRNIFREKMQDPDHPGRKFLIKKGNIPMNKGKKQTEYMSPEAIERTKATRFRKGNLPPNTMHDYAITERRDKTGRTYKYIRVGLANWILYHRYIWEQAHGPIPEGYNIQFKDGNSLNCTLDNLYMISRSKQLKNENSLHARYPEELRKLIQLKGALNRQINKANKINKENGTD